MRLKILLSLIVAVLCQFNEEGGTFAEKPAPKEPQMATTEIPEEKCARIYENFNYEEGAIYCHSLHDGYACWGPTRAGETVVQQCPNRRLSDTTQLAFRTCGESGVWLDRQLRETDSRGWTNFTLCFPEEVKLLLDIVSEQDAQAKFEIARTTRLLELVGYSISLVALLASLFIFGHFRSLHNNRTNIHMNLFAAMVLQVTTRLLIYVDQELVRNNVNEDSENTKHGIENTRAVCEVMYVIMEYGNAVIFTWMFIEGLYLNILITSQVLKTKVPALAKYIFAWGLPLFFTMSWAIVTALDYEEERVQKCWYGYNFKQTYWIIQGPKLAIIVVNYIFLINILRVLIQKLRQSDRKRTSIVSYRLLWVFNIKLEPHLLRILKALRAAFFLVPLLGLANVFDMLEAPLSGPMWKFALWSYSVHFLRSFQGLILAILYCFLNEEVKSVIMKRYKNFKANRETGHSMKIMFRNNELRAAGPAAIETSSSSQHGPQSISEGTQRELGFLHHLQRPRYTKTLAAKYSSLPSVLAWRPSIYSNPPSDELRRVFSLNDVGCTDRAVENRGIILFKNIQDAAAHSLSAPCRMISLTDHKDRPSSRRMLRDVQSTYLSYEQEKSKIKQDLEGEAVEHVRPSSWGHGLRVLSPHPRRRQVIKRPTTKKTAITNYEIPSMRNRQDTEIEKPARKYKLAKSDSMQKMKIFSFEKEIMLFKKKTYGTKTNIDQKGTAPGQFVTTATIESGEGRSSYPKTQSTGTKLASIGNRQTASVQQTDDDYDAIEEFEDGYRSSSITEEAISKSPSIEQEATPGPSQEETETDKIKEHRSSITEGSEAESISLEYEQATSGPSQADTVSSMDEHRSLSSATDYARRPNLRRESYESNTSAASGTSRKSVRFNLEKNISHTPTDQNTE